MSDPKIDGSDIFPWENTMSFLFFSSKACEIHFINLDTLAFSTHIFYLAKSQKIYLSSLKSVCLEKSFCPSHITKKTSPRYINFPTMFSTR